MRAEVSANEGSGEVQVLPALPRRNGSSSAVSGAHLGKKEVFLRRLVPPDPESEVSREPERRNHRPAGVLLLLDDSRRRLA